MWLSMVLTLCPYHVSLVIDLDAFFENLESRGAEKDAISLGRKVERLQSNLDENECASHDLDKLFMEVCYMALCSQRTLRFRM